MYTTFSSKRVNDEVEAEDISIQTFAKAFDKLHTYDEHYSFRTWLITISKNIHIDNLRKQNENVVTFRPRGKNNLKH